MKIKITKNACLGGKVLEKGKVLEVGKDLPRPLPTALLNSEHAEEHLEPPPQQPQQTPPPPPPNH